MANFGKSNDSFINNYFTSNVKEYIDEYEKNLETIKTNLIKIDTLVNLTKMGQLQALVSSTYSKLNYGVIKTSSEEIFSNLQDALTGAGIIATSLHPEIALAASAISTKLKLENFRLHFKNDMVLIPFIRKGAPSYAGAHIPGSEGYGRHYFSGGGANGSW